MRSNKQITTLVQTALVTAALTAAMTTAAPMFGQTSQVDNPDWPLRSSEIHWPTGHTPADADLFAHNELLIHSSCSNVWQHLVQAQTWPEWYSKAERTSWPRVGAEKCKIADVPKTHFCHGHAHLF